MNRKFLGLMTGAVLTATVFAGCGGGGGGAASFQYDPPPGGPTPPPQQARTFSLPSFGAADRATLVFTPVSTDELDAAQNLLQVNAVIGRVADTKLQQEALSEPVAKIDFCGVQHADVEVSEHLAAKPWRIEVPHARSQARFDGKPQGSTDEVISPATLLPVSVKKMLADSQTIHCNILAETDTNGNTVISEATALRIAQVFDAANPYDITQPNAIGIYDRLTGLCGSEWRASGGMDGDIRVNIVLLSAAQMGGAHGIVSKGDLLPKSALAFSNEGEFLFINADSTFFAQDGLTDAQYSGGFHTVAHEFIHLITNNRKIATDGTFLNLNRNEPLQSVLDLGERRSLSEGFAETGATMAGFGMAHALVPGALGGVNDTSFMFISEYLKNPVLGLFDPANPNNYGEGHLLGLYIIDRFGIEAMGNVIRSSRVGLQNLQITLGTAQENLMHSFNVRVYASSLTNLPPELRFSMFATGPSNPPVYVRNMGSNLSTLTTVPAPPHVGGISATQFAEALFSPWSTVLVAISGGTGGPLQLEVTLPLRARASLIHESPAGTFSSLQGQ